QQSILVRYRLRFASLFQLSLSEAASYSRFLHTRSFSPEKACPLPRDEDTTTK
ncbi:hypothetical protein N324_11024, partial [Chlamydotis macqueenii]